MVGGGDHLDSAVGDVHHGVAGDVAPGDGHIRHDLGPAGGIIALLTLSYPTSFNDNIIQ